MDFRFVMKNIETSSKRSTIFMKIDQNIKNSLYLKVPISLNRTRKPSLFVLGNLLGLRSPRPDGRELHGSHLPGVPGHVVGHVPGHVTESARASSELLCISQTKDFSETV